MLSSLAELVEVSESWSGQVLFIPIVRAKHKYYSILKQQGGSVLTLQHAISFTCTVIA